MPTPPSPEQVRKYFQECSNWGRWGKDDQLGTVNFITPSKRKQAAGLVKEGVSVTCSRVIRRENQPDVTDPPVHFMIATGEKYAGGVKTGSGELQMSLDFIGISYHGSTTTHIDSLCHVFFDGKMYNGFPAEAVTSREGGTKENVDLLANGVLTRGVLLDIARLKGVNWLEPGTPVFPEDLDAAEKASGVRVEPGDLLFVRTGWLRQRNERGPGDLARKPGLHAACLPWLHKREVAVLGGDTINDVTPTGYDLPRVPIHQVGIVAMGLWLIDNANLEDLAATCERYRRWEFQVTVNPLRIANGTGSPVNPVATF